MRKDTDHAGVASADDPEDDDTSWLAKYPSETVEAVPVTEATAGVTITRYDLSDVDEPPLFEISTNYPPEDGVEDNAVYVHTDPYALEIASALIALAANEMDVPDGYRGVGNDG